MFSLLNDIITSTITNELLRKKEEYEKEVERLNNIINNNKMSFDELYSLFRSFQIEDKETFWIQFFKKSNLFNSALSYSYSQIPDSSLPINASYVCLEFALFTLKFNVSSFSSPNIIVLKFKTDCIQSFQWMKEAVLSENIQFQCYEEFLNYSHSNQNYINHCLLLNMLEDFQQEHSYKKYKNIINFANDSNIDIKNKSTIINFLIFKKNLNYKIKEELSIIKYEHGKEEMYEYGISESKHYFSSAFPSVVSILENFSNLEERLIIDNYPLSEVIKSEIISRIENSNKKNDNKQ